MKSKPNTTVYQRFECIDPQRNDRKFYELSVEMLLFGPTVTRRWGRIGSRRPRVLSKDYETWEEAKREVNAIFRKRERRGYRETEGQRRKVGGERLELRDRPANSYKVWIFEYFC